MLAERITPKVQVGGLYIHTSRFVVDNLINLRTCSQFGILVIICRFPVSNYFTILRDYFR